MPIQNPPLIALMLSALLPGLGQWYNGERAKGLVVLCIDLGIAGGIVLATVGPTALRSWLTVIMLGLAYVFIWIPSIIDAYQYAGGARKPLLSGERTWYVIFMLLTVGPAAIPLLWQSPRFSQAAKIGWTIGVILIALGGIMFAVVLGPALEQSSQHLLQNLKRLP